MAASFETKEEFEDFMYKAGRLFEGQELPRYAVLSDKTYSLLTERPPDSTVQKYDHTHMSSVELMSVFQKQVLDEVNKRVAEHLSKDCLYKALCNAHFGTS